MSASLTFPGYFPGTSIYTWLEGGAFQGTKHRFEGSQNIGAEKDTNMNSDPMFSEEEIDTEK